MNKNNKLTEKPKLTKFYIIIRTGPDFNTNPITKDQYEEEPNKKCINFSPKKTVKELIEFLRDWNYITTDTKHFFISSGFDKTFYTLNTNNSKIKTLVPYNTSEILLLCY